MAGRWLNRQGKDGESFWRFLDTTVWAVVSEVGGLLVGFAGFLARLRKR